MLVNAVGVVPLRYAIVADFHVTPLSTEVYIMGAMNTVRDVESACTGSAVDAVNDVVGIVPVTSRHTRPSSEAMIFLAPGTTMSPFVALKDVLRPSVEPRLMLPLIVPEFTNATESRIASENLVQVAPSVDLNPIAFPQCIETTIDVLPTVPAITF
ncbi:hypothetical protein D3C75_797800 [compost metagenome]